MGTKLHSIAFSVGNIQLPGKRPCVNEIKMLLKRNGRCMEGKFSIYF